MILFRRISYRNFKSVGNSPIVVELDKAKTTLITGKNGSGKSTLTSAICFGLFGQDFTLNKPGLVNSINQKKLEVTIEFDIGDKKYKIHRGMKPNIFKIYENDVLLNEDSSTRDYQKVLESQILKMDIRAFKQVVIVGGRSYVPFMKLKPNDRREFIEDLLDIRLFSVMSSLLKEKGKVLKEDIRLIDEELKTIREKVKLQESFTKKLTEEKGISLSKLEAGIERLERENEELSSELQTNIDLELKYKKLVDGYKEVPLSLASLSQEVKSINLKKSKWNEKIKFYETTDTCPTCTQVIQQDHRDHIIKETCGELDELDVNVTELTDKINDLKSKLEIQAGYQQQVSEQQSKISALENKVFSNIKLINSARKQIEEMKVDTSSIDTEKEKLKEFAGKYVLQDKAKKKLIETQQYNDYVSSILADGGIKSKIIKQYIPTINKLINKYLSLLDFFISFHLDENFDETIKSRHRDTFKYDNFSDGQAARIDLSLMFAWRDIARMRNAVNTNLAIFDEADAAVDGDGAGLLIELLQKLEKSNVFVISHKGDALVDKVDDVIKFAIKDNFTVLES